ncbi:MAG TPA: adenylyltransferase/cytidyltransferase family protein [Chitinophaga sp.]
MRALFALDWHNATAAQLDALIALQTHYTELVLVISRPETLLDGPSPLCCRDLLPALQALLQPRLQRPFYLLPIPGRGLPDYYHWLRWRITCPAFHQVFTDNPAQQKAMEQLFRVPVTVIPRTGPPITWPPVTGKKRGIFITRAQPFHNGHAAYLEQMQQEVEEVIVVVGVANQSHTLKDFATAGERLEMVQPYLQQTWPGRYYLAALPYSDFSLENFYELEYLLPAFHTVYTINTSTITYAQTAGYPVKNLSRQLDVSGTEVRNCMLHDQPYAHLVPAAVHAYLQSGPLPGRLKQLAEKENR